MPPGFLIDTGPNWWLGHSSRNRKWWRFLHDRSPPLTAEYGATTTLAHKVNASHTVKAEPGNDWLKVALPQNLK